MTEATMNSFIVAKYKAKVKQLKQRLKTEIEFSVDFPCLEIYSEIKETRTKLKEAEEVLSNYIN